MFFFRVAILIFHGIILLLLAGTMLNAYIPPKVFPYLNLLSLAFPVLMIINIFLCIFWVISFKKRAIVLIIISLFFLTPVKRWINYTGNKNGNIDFKVVSFNNKVNDYGKKNVEEYIDSFDADVVFLQEAGYDKTGNPILKNMENNIHNPIVSMYTKHKVLKKETIQFISNGDAQYMDVEIKRKVVRLVNVYLEPYQLNKSMVKPDINGNEEKAKGLLRRFLPVFKVHQEQVEVLRDFIKDSPYPVVLAGDFNSVPNSFEYYTISELLKDAFLEAGNGSATSFHDYKFPIRIDYIFSSKKIFAKSYGVDRSRKVSDHFPVIAEFSFKN